jgi:hypothetical protein
LLNVALMWTTARLTLRRVLRFLALATVRLLLVNRLDSVSAHIAAGILLREPQLAGSRS